MMPRTGDGLPCSLSEHMFPSLPPEPCHELTFDFCAEPEHRTPPAWMLGGGRGFFCARGSESWQREGNFCNYRIGTGEGRVPLPRLFLSPPFSWNTRRVRPAPRSPVIPTGKPCRQKELQFFLRPRRAFPSGMTGLLTYTSETAALLCPRKATSRSGKVARLSFSFGITGLLHGWIYFLNRPPRLRLPAASLLPARSVPLPTRPAPHRHRRPVMSMWKPRCARSTAQKLAPLSFPPGMTGQLHGGAYFLDRPLHLWLSAASLFADSFLPFPPPCATPFPCLPSPRIPVMSMVSLVAF